MLRFVCFQDAGYCNSLAMITSNLMVTGGQVRIVSLTVVRWWSLSNKSFFEMVSNYF